VQVQTVLNVQNVTIEERYLGLPTPDGRTNKGRFKSTKERLANKCSSWAKRHMSGGATEVLLKSVAQAIPTYVMGVFRLPNTLCEELTEMIRYFWCGGGGDSDHRKVHWLA
jgi:hypothetical protein